MFASPSAEDTMGPTAGAGIISENFSSISKVKVTPPRMSAVFILGICRRFPVLAEVKDMMSARLGQQVVDGERKVGEREDETSDGQPVYRVHRYSS